MKKDSIICFRASRDLHDSLAKVSQEEKRSLSSIIEIVLTKFLKERKMFKGTNKERRQHPRKAVLAPALIKKYGPGETKLTTGAITDISLGGAQITIPKDAMFDILADPQTSKFEIVITLPNENRPIHLTCMSCRVVDSEESVHIGASFINADFYSYKALQTYLI